MRMAIFFQQFLMREEKIALPTVTNHRKILNQKLHQARTARKNFQIQVRQTANLSL